MHFTREQRDAWAADTRDSPFNVWLKRRVADGRGGLDLTALHAVAAEYGVDASAYAHLNPGQQRMNIGNRLRRCVPRSAYAAAGVEQRPVPTRSPPESGTLPPGSATPESLQLASDRELMRLYGSVLDELRGRDVIRTANAPVGDYAEHLFAKAFGWRLEANSSSGHDAVDPAGARIQIKTRRLRLNAPSERQLSAIRGLPEAKFDLLAVVLFDGRFGIVRAALVPHRVVVKRAKYIAHDNGWRLTMDDPIWNEPGVREVTLQLAAAQGSV